MTDLATSKMMTLKKYLGKPVKPAQAYVDLGKITEGQRAGDIWYADCNLDVDGKRYYAKAEANSLRTAIDKMVGELGREVRGAKKKQESMLRRGGARVKRFFNDFRNG